MKCFELAEVHRHGLGHQVLLDEFGMLLDCRSEIGKDHSVLQGVRIDLAVDRRGIALNDDAALGDISRNTDLIEGKNTIERSNCLANTGKG